MEGILKITLRRGNDTRGTRFSITYTDCHDPNCETMGCDQMACTAKKVVVPVRMDSSGYDISKRAVDRLLGFVGEIVKFNLVRGTAQLLLEGEAEKPVKKTCVNCINYRKFSRFRGICEVLSARVNEDFEVVDGRTKGPLRIPARVIIHSYSYCNSHEKK